MSVKRAEDMVWHDEFPLQRSRARSDSGSFQPPSNDGSHISLGNRRLATPVNRRRIAIVALIFTLVVILALLCATLAIVVKWRKDENAELVYLRSMLDQLASSRDVHDDPPVQNTAPVSFFEGGTNPPTISSIPSMSPSIFDQVSNSPSGASVESVVPTADETPQPTSAPVIDTPAPVSESTPSPVEPDTPAPVSESTPSPVEETPSPVVVPVPESTPAPAGEASVCIDQYTAFLVCQGENGEACSACDISLPGDLGTEADCENFNLWLDGNVECCTGDECGADLDALETCKNCLAESPFAPFAPVFQETPAPVIEETPAPVIEETEAPAIEVTPAPMTEVPATPSPVAEPGETPQPVSAPSPDIPIGAWTQVGQDITWNNAASDDATSLVMSGDGTTVAVGQFENAFNSGFGGQVNVYRLNDDGTWSPLGPTIESDLTTGSFGYAVSLNEDGTVLAVSNPDDGSGTTGSVLVYELLVDTWMRRGQTLDGGGPDQFAGGGVVLSDDGNTILYEIHVTARQPGATKFVRVFRYNGSNWEKVGQDVYAQVATLTDTLSIDLSGDGSKFALAATVPGFGYCETYELSGNTWELYGEILPDPMMTNESIGLSVSLDRDGNTLAVGIRLFQTSDVVRGYSFDDEWVQLGADVNSEGSVSSNIMTIDLSSDGQTIAIGPQEDTAFASVHAYDIFTDTWSKIGENIDAGISTTASQVQSISLAETGPRVAVFGVDGENVQVYDSTSAIARKRIKKRSPREG